MILFLAPIPLPLLLLLGLHPPLLLLLPFGLIACVGSRLSGLFRIMLLSPLSLRLLPGLPLPCLFLLTLRMCSFLPLLVLFWVLWWLRAMWCRSFLIVLSCLFVFCLLGSLLLQLGVSALWRGGCSLFLAFLLSQWFFVEGVPNVAFDAQFSPGPANSL